MLTRSVRAARRIHATPERVFAAWLDPALARRWLFATATRPTERVEIDARVGGAFLIADGERSIAYAGTYLEIDAPRRLAFALSVERATTRVTVDFTQSRGGCTVRLVHDDVPRERARALADRWCGMLYGLDEILAATPIVQRRIRPTIASHSTPVWRSAP